MIKKRLLSMLVLLMTAVTGAWAQDAKHLITATYDKQTRSLEQPLPYATTVGELYEAVTGQSFSSLISTMTAMENPLSGIGSTNTDVVSIGGLNGASTPVTVKADGKAAVAIRFGSYTQGIFVSVTSPLYVTMKDDVKDADKWTVKVGEGQAQALPIGGLKGDGSETVTLQYNGRLKVKSVTATSEAAPAAPTGNTVDLSTLTANYEAQNGDVLSGETAYAVTIADGATVTLDGATISRSSYCIKCAGSATIILKDGSTNTLTGTGNEYPALWAGDDGTTLTIQGSTGALTVQSGTCCAGIGGGWQNTNNTCGNIRIEGGVITATGGSWGAGIGSDGGPAHCGNIEITGGTVTATGGMNAAGIGTGEGDEYEASCGNITITNGVTKVTAKKGAYAPNSIGKGDGDNASCGTVTIGCTLDTNGNPVGGTKYWENNAAVGDGATYLAQATIEYPAAPAGITAARAAYQGTNAPSQNWTKGDKLYVYGPGQVLMGTLVADADGAEVLMAGKLDFTKTGTTAPMTLTLSNLPLPMDYSTHDGQLSTVQSKMNYAMATATATAIDAEAGTVTLDAKPTLQPQQALVKLMLQNTGGTAISPSSLTVNLDASGGYSTINLLRFDVSNEGAGDWIYGGATYENGIITLPKAGGCGCGWKPALWEGVDLTKFTGATCSFAQPLSGDCLIFVAYKKSGSEDQLYSPGSTISSGATYAWVGIPSDATEILGIYFALIDATQSDVKVYPSDLRLSKIGGFTLSPNASEVYIPFKGTEPGSTLRLDATVSGTSYSSSTTGINFAEGSYYEKTVNMTVKAGN